MPQRVLKSIVLIPLAVLALVGCQPDREGERQHLTIGLITNNRNGLRNIQGFKDGMAQLGYVEEENVMYLLENDPVSAENLDSALQSMVDDEVDLIFTAGTPTGVAARKVTAGSGIPVVFGVIADPIAAGVMTDLTQPGGNMTGVMLSENQARRLELLLEIAPPIERVYVPYDDRDAASTSAVEQIKGVSAALGITIVEGVARSDEEVTDLLAAFPPDVQAVFLVPGTTVNARLKDINAIALDRNLPVSAPSTAQVEEGSLTTYGFIHHEVGVQAARIADQVLKGTEPGSIPVETAELFLAINLLTAEAIGLEVPYELLQQAEMIIRSDNK